MVKLSAAVLSGLLVASAGRLLAPKDAPVVLSAIDSSAVDRMHKLKAAREAEVDEELAFHGVVEAKTQAAPPAPPRAPQRYEKTANEIFDAFEAAPAAANASEVGALFQNATANATVKANATAKANVSDMEQIEKLQEGLKSIQKVRSLFANTGAGPHVDAEKFADGALSTELSKQDSKVWSSIEDMMAESMSAMSKMKALKGNKAEQSKVMESLENSLNNKASVLNSVTDVVSKKQREQDEEYLLGLLIMHQKDWSMKQQLNATATFVKDSPLIKELYEHGDQSKSLAPQFAAMLDKVAKSHSPKAAAKLFLQLASSLRQ